MDDWTRQHAAAWAERRWSDGATAEAFVAYLEATPDAVERGMQHGWAVVADAWDGSDQLRPVGRLDTRY